MDYLRRQAGEAFPPLIPLMWTLNVLLVRANCHKVIRLSRGVQVSVIPEEFWKLIDNI